MISTGSQIDALWAFLLIEVVLLIGKELMRSNTKYKVGNEVFFIFNNGYHKTTIKDVLKSVFESESKAIYYLEGEEFDGYYFDEQDLFANLLDLKEEADKQFFAKYCDCRDASKIKA